MNGNSTRPVAVTTGGNQVVAHAGLHALGSFADRIGLGDSLSTRIPWAGERMPLHDRGKVLVQAMLMLAGGGEACTDIEHFRGQDTLFGSVPSASTMYRTITSLKPSTVTGLWDAIAEVRANMWDRALLTAGDDTVRLDIDATLIDIHSENKQGAAPTFKRGFGLHPMFIFADTTGEALGAMLRPGNAGANTVTDHVDLLDQAIGQLPTRIAVGHQIGDAADIVERRVQVRADSAGCTEGFVKACRARNVGFAVVARRNTHIHAAISKIYVNDTRWQPARTQSGNLRKGAEVAEITDLANLDNWPTGTRLIVRREPKHPGAQRSLFPSDNYRYWGHYTDTDSTVSAVECDQIMRAHAHVEDHIQRLKDSGLERLPFTDFDHNAAWCALVAWADTLVRWFQRLTLTGPLAAANPKRLRWQLWHTPARLISTGRRHVMRLLDTWPGTPDLLHAYTRINAIT
jgi:hypothetical protein